MPANTNTKSVALVELELARLGMRKPDKEIEPIQMLMHNAFVSWLIAWPNNEKDQLREWFIRHQQNLTEALFDIEDTLCERLRQPLEQELLSLMHLEHERCKAIVNNEVQNVA